MREKLHRFGIEVVLVIAFLLLGWYLDSTIGPLLMHHLIGIGLYTNEHALWIGLLLLVFFGMVFYGTSFEVTPLTILVRLSRLLIRERVAAALTSLPQAGKDLFTINMLDTSAFKVVVAAFEHFPYFSNIIEIHTHSILNQRVF